MKNNLDNININNIILASPRGFCAGVRRAIDTVDKALEIYGKPIYIKHQVVHNNHITKRLLDKGAITIEEFEDIPNNSNVIFSAHGSCVNDFDIAKEKGLNVIDSICPLVEKVHIEARKFAEQGYKIIYIGKKGHKEAEGVLSQAPQSISIIENVDDLKSIEIHSGEKVACLTQTTLNYNNTQIIINEVKKQFPNVILPPKEDICFSTTNRQKAIKEVALKSDLVLVVGSSSSSNSNRLVEVTKQYVKNAQAYLIDDISCIDLKWFDVSVKTLGLSCGASVPEDLVQEIVEFFRDKGVVIEEIKVTCEKMNFGLPCGVLK